MTLRHFLSDWRAAAIVAALLTACGPAAEPDAGMPDDGPFDGGAIGGPLVEITAATEDDCAVGGQVVRVGIDQNGDGTLQDNEVDNRAVICVPGNALVETSEEPAGENCEFGGVRVDVGVDDDGNGELGADEVDGTAFVCDGRPGDPGIDGLIALVAISIEPAGENCLSGGQRVDSGLDDDRDGTLGELEIDDTVFVCNGDDGAPGEDGEDGFTSLIEVNPLAPGIDCPAGGQQIRSGLDRDLDDVLDDDEVTDDSVVCNPLQNLVVVTAEAPGDNCESGGSRIDSGLDDNANGILDALEIDATTFACSTTGASSLVSLTPEPAGANCVNGGQRIDTGIDDNENGTLEAGEVDSTSYVCNSASSVPFAIITDGLPEASLGTPYSGTVTAIGGTGGDYAWSVVAGSLPAGLSLSATGTPSTTITGTPTATGSSTFTVRVEDFFGQAVDRELTIATAEDLAVTAFVLDATENGVAYSDSLAATGGSGMGYSWTIENGTLPPGLTLAGATGAITGTPTTVSGASFVVEVTDSDDNTRTALVLIPAQSRWVAYGGDVDTDGTDEVFVSDVTGAAPGAQTRVSPSTRPTGATIGTSVTNPDIELSPDGTTLAFIAEFDATGVEELYLVDVSTSTPGAPTKVNGMLVSGGDVTDFRWAPDSSRIAYRADQDTDNVFEVYVAEVAGGAPGAPLKANGAIVTNGDVNTDDYRFSPDGDGFAYLADEDTDAVEELYYVDLTVTPLVSNRVSQPQASGGDVDDFFFFTLDSGALIYRGDVRSSTFSDLYWVNIAGATPGSPIQVNATLQASGTVAFDDYALSPDGRRLWYIADQDLDNADELYVVDITPTGPGTARKLSTTVASANQDVDEAFWSPDSRRIAYVGDTAVLDVDEIFLVNSDPSSTSGSIRLNPALTSITDVEDDSQDVRWAPDGSAVFYLMDFNADSRIELFRTVLATAGTATQLNGAVSTSSDVEDDFRVALDGSAIAFLVDQTTSGENNLFYVDLSGATPGAATQLNSALPSLGDVLDTAGSFRFLGDSTGIVYRGDTVTNDVFEIFWVDLSGATPGTETRVNGTVVTGGDVDFISVPTR